MNIEGRITTVTGAGRGAGGTSLPSSPMARLGRVVKAAVRTLAAAGILLIGAATAEAQQLCLVRDQAVTQLMKQYEEQAIGRGVADQGKAMVELFASEKGSWTLVVTGVDGRSCVITGGVSWINIQPPRGDPA